MKYYIKFLKWIRFSYTLKLYLYVKDNLYVLLSRINVVFFPIKDFLCILFFPLCLSFYCTPINFVYSKENVCSKLNAYQYFIYTNLEKLFATVDYYKVNQYHQVIFWLFTYFIHRLIWISQQRVCECVMRILHKRWQSYGIWKLDKRLFACIKC